ncbi:hypothetical protein [Acinetobacter guillouiae]|uniref:hypothetical protein n=1 Tax=Acinetobacter guillouiae TaxID=106649 RepID=UPI001AE95B6F|nr:hypothetical protein [Acinetobacter guillouiae]MBP2544668.1 hypothetical protein [Acinetobacter guillouiae]
MFIETILKVIPFIPLTPLLYFIFSKTFRLSKKRKYYEAQINILDDYIKNYYKNNSLEFSLRDLKARQTTCNNWVGAKFLDYAISRKCPNIFESAADFDRAWFVIKLKDDDGGVKISSKYKKSSLKKFFYIPIYLYLFFGGFLIFNKFSLIFLSYFGLSGIPIYGWLYDFAQFISVFFLVISSILIITIGRGIASALALSKKLPINFKIN